jgi:hypothetical protein
MLLTLVSGRFLVEGAQKGHRRKKDEGHDREAYVNFVKCYIGVLYPNAHENGEPKKSPHNVWLYRKVTGYLGGCLLWSDWSHVTVFHQVIPEGDKLGSQHACHPVAPIMISSSDLGHESK